MQTFTSSEVAVAVSRSASTIRNWTDQAELQPFLSDAAKREGEHKDAKERRYTEEDLYVFSTVRELDPNKTSWEDIAERLELGYRVEALLPSAALVLANTQMDSFQLATIARQEITSLQNEVGRLQKELSVERSARLHDVERLVAQGRDEAEGKVVELNRTIARLELLLEQERDKNKKDEETD